MEDIKYLDLPDGAKVHALFSAEVSSVRVIEMASSEHDVQEYSDGKWEYCQFYADAGKLAAYKPGSFEDAMRLAHTVFTHAINHH